MISFAKNNKTYLINSYKPKSYSYIDCNIKYQDGLVRKRRYPKIMVLPNYPRDNERTYDCCRWIYL